MPMGQGRQQQVLRNLRVGADDQGTGHTAFAARDHLVDRFELQQQRPARFEILLAAGGQLQALRVALEQPHAQRRLQRVHQLLHRRHGDAEPAPGSRQAAFLGGGNEVLQGSQLVHASSAAQMRDDHCALQVAVR